LPSSIDEWGQDNKQVQLVNTTRHVTFDAFVAETASLKAQEMEP
jgi:hypothetical protein